ncbi:unnamed protein product [Aureobasidium vineae]|uniref:Inheritance of peroxisomes protein 1 n=1 Tax=Aureobasidium vineae TaxID=2773715 RepID=A0A9N8P5E9_9PEZI|nr:unnamed protein product [Aureobasidium vineae]
MSSRPSSSTSKDMPSASAPGTALRRSFTLPSRLANPKTIQQQVEIGSADGIETLFVHPSAKIVSFSTASSLRSRPSSRSSIASYDGEGDASTSLLWTSPTERTMAAEIYRVPGSVAFLHSGSLLHAILPRSQCWCVDGVSKFAMRVLPNTYYRIELPGTTQEDLEHVEQLKKTLAKVLYYEKTACPFQRGFGEDLPEMPSRNSRRLSREFIEPAKRWRLDKVWRPEGADLEEPQLLHPDRSKSRSTSRSDTERSELEDSVKSEEEGGKEQDTRPASRGDKTSQLSGPFPSKRLAAMRSVTAPPQLSLESSPPSRVNKVRKMAGIFDQTARDTAPPLARPLSSALVPRLPSTPESPLYSPDYHIHEDVTSDEQPNSTQIRPVTVMVEETKDPSLREPLILVEQIGDETELNTTEDSTYSNLPKQADATVTQTLLPEESQEQAPPPQPSPQPPSQQQHPGPLSPKTHLYSPNKNLPALLVRKTCALFLGPPANLVATMLRIAARLVASGALNLAEPAFHDMFAAGGAAAAATAVGRMRGHRRVPGSWDLSDDDEDWGF